MEFTTEMMQKLIPCGKINTGDLENILDDARREEKLMARGIKTPKITQREKNGVVQFYTVVPARFSRDGKRHQVVCKTEEECRKKVQKIILDAVEDNRERSVNDVVEEFLKIKKSSIKYTSYTMYEGLYGRYIKKSAFGESMIDAVRLPECQVFVDSLYNKKLSYTTIKMTKALLTMSFEYAISRDFILRNYMRSVVINKNLCGKSQKSETLAWTDEEIKIMREKSMEAWHVNKNHSKYAVSAAVLLMIYTGCRVGEVTALTWDDVDFEKGTMAITKTISTSKNVKTGKYELYCSTAKTASSNRIVVLTDTAIEWLHEIKSRQAEIGLQTKFVIATKYGTPIRPHAIDVQMRAFLEFCGIDYMSSHAGRKTYASIMLDGGISATDVAKDLGHTSVSTTLSTYYKQRQDTGVVLTKKNNLLLATVGNTYSTQKNTLKHA